MPETTPLAWILQLLWITGVLLMTGILFRTVRPASTTPSAFHPGSRIVAGLLIVAAVFTSIAGMLGWGDRVAVEGVSLLRQRSALGERADAGAEPEAKVFLQFVQMRVPRPGEGGRPGLSATIGFSNDAALQLPRSYPLPEAELGSDVARVAAVGHRGLRIEGLPPAGGSTSQAPATGASRVFVVPAGPGGWDPVQPNQRVHEAWKRHVQKGGRIECRQDGPSVTDAANENGVQIVFLCAANADGKLVPTTAMELDRTPPVETGATDSVAVRVRPYRYGPGGFGPLSLTIRRHQLIAIGASSETLPGMALWEVPTPPLARTVLYPPADLLGECAAWTRNNPSMSDGIVQPFVPGTRPESARTGEWTGGSTCPAWASPPFALEVRRLLPDVPLVSGLSRLATVSLVVPACLALLGFILLGGSRRDLSNLGSLGGLLLASVILAALMTQRLLWAHRADMLRAWEPVHDRVGMNLLLLVLASAAVAGNAAGWLARMTAAGERRKVALPLIASFLGWLLAGTATALAAGPDLTRNPLWNAEHLAPSLSNYAMQIALSLALGTGAAWWPAIVSLMDSGRDGGTARWWQVLRGFLFEGFCIGLAAAPLAKPIAAVNLFVAWLAGPILYSAFRYAQGRNPPGRRILRPLLAVLPAVVLAFLDTGVAVAIAGSGMSLAALVFAHDLALGPEGLSRTRGYARKFVPFTMPVLVAAGLAALVLAIVAGFGAIEVVRAPNAPEFVRGRVSFPQTLTSATILAVGIVLAGVCAGTVLSVAAWRDRGRYLLAVAAGALVLVLAAAGTTAGARAWVLSKTLQSDETFAHRVAASLSPAHLLLYDTRAFLWNVGAWSETVAPEPRLNVTGEAQSGEAKASPRSRKEIVENGLGYFGAQVVDPGIRQSIENDYFAVLLTRETGAMGLGRMMLFFLALTVAIWLAGSNRFASESAGRRARQVVGLQFGLLAFYQPIAALGALPLTGISWPGLGIDSPGDFWPVAALLLIGLAWTEGSGGSESVLPEAELRSVRRVSAVAIGVSVLGALCLVSVALATGRFAGYREAPYDDSRKAWNAPYDKMDSIFQYADRDLRCSSDAWRDDAVGRFVLPEPDFRESDEGVARDPWLKQFAQMARSRWGKTSDGARTSMLAFLQDPSAARCGTSQEFWKAGGYREDGEGRSCTFTFRVGWPSVRFQVTRTFAGGQSGTGATGFSGTCSVETEDVDLRILGHRPPKGEPPPRIRLVSRPMGDAAYDVGEVLGRGGLVRLRPGIGRAADRAEATDSVLAVDRLQVASDLALVVSTRAEGTPVGRLVAGGGQDTGGVGSWVLLQRPAGGGEGDPEWEIRRMGDHPNGLDLDRMAVILAGDGGRQEPWLYRPATLWPGEKRPSVGMLLADDVRGVFGERRRKYVFGTVVPEVGWANPWSVSNSLGLDGWIRASVVQQRSAPGGTAPTGWNEFVQAHCGVLDPPSPSAPGIPPEVCATSPLDGVLECRVSPQPELQARLRTLLELVSLKPRKLGLTARPAVESSYALLRGDTGEIVAQGSFVPGRESSAFAPRTPRIERYLIDALDDPHLKERPNGVRNEQTGAEAAGWTEPIAVGSSMKPLFALAAARVDPAFTDALTVSTARSRNACLRGKAAPVLGHCPPTPSVWLHGGEAGVREFLSLSKNWYQATLGLLGTALGGGTVRFGPKGVEMGLRDLVRDTVFAGSRPTTEALATRQGGRDVILANRRVDMNALDRTPFWTEVQRVMGRPFCPGPTKEDCDDQAAVGDICSVRAMPVTAPSSQMRKLVSLGPGVFQFAPNAKEKKTAELPDGQAAVIDYLQFLRGAGEHRLGSALQLADAYNRYFYDGTGPGQRFRLAASWFPAKEVGRIPPHACSGTGLVAGAGGSSGARPNGEISAGTCGTLTGKGTAAKAWGALLNGFKGIRFLGAKTGTSETLGDLLKHPEKPGCYVFNVNHTPDLGNRDKRSAYWLACNPELKSAPNVSDVDDSLFALGFAVATADGVETPLTLVLRFEGITETGMATFASIPFVELARDYFAP